MKIFSILTSYSVQCNRRGGDMHEYELAPGMYLIIQGKNDDVSYTCNFMLIEIKTDQFCFESEYSNMLWKYGVSMYTLPIQF